MSFSVSLFCQAFTASNSPINASQQSNFSVEELVHVFNSSCIDILDFVAPVRVRKLKPSLPWLNEEIRNNAGRQNGSGKSLK